MAKKTILLRDIKGLWLPPHPNDSPVKGQALTTQNLMEDAFLLSENGKIVNLGPMKNIGTLIPEAVLENADSISCQNRFVLPAFVDAHSHLVFAAWRGKRNGNEVERCYLP